MPADERTFHFWYVKLDMKPQHQRENRKSSGFRWIFSSWFSEKGLWEEELQAERSRIYGGNKGSVLPAAVYITSIINTQQIELISTVWSGCSSSSSRYSHVEAAVYTLIPFTHCSFSSTARRVHSDSDVTRAERYSIMLTWIICSNIHLYTQTSHWHEAAWFAHEERVDFP